MYGQTNVLGVTISAATSATMAYTGFNSLLAVWAALAFVFLGLLVLRWSATIGVSAALPGMTDQTEGHYRAPAADHDGLRRP